MTQYALERKESVVHRMLSPANVSITKFAKESGISEATLYWRNRTRNRGKP